MPDNARRTWGRGREAGRIEKQFGQQQRKCILFDFGSRDERLWKFEGRGRSRGLRRGRKV